MQKIIKVVVFIPAYNEEKSVLDVLNRVQELYPEDVTCPKGFRVEILVVNDGSTDKTNEIVQSKGITIVSHPRNLGLGAATRTGMETAYEMGADIAIKLDADFQHDPADIEKVIMPIMNNLCDICWGSRFAGTIHYKMPFVRLVGNKFFTGLMNVMTEYNISDAQTGMMAFGRKYLGIFEIHGDYNPPQQLLIDAHYKHMRYMEVPVTFHPRTTGNSFVSMRYPFYVFGNIFKILTYANPLKVFSTIGVFFIMFSIFHFVFSSLIKKYHWDIPYFFLENLSLVTLFIGMQSFFFGILADLISRKRK